MNDNYIKIIQINDKLTRYEKEIKYILNYLCMNDNYIKIIRQDLTYIY